MSLLWVRINCDHEGFDDLADELADSNINDGFCWFYWKILKSTLKPSKGEMILCLVTIIILFDGLLN